MRAPLDSAGSLISSSWWCLSSEADQINFTAVENHAYIVEKDALILYCSCTRHKQHPSRTSAGRHFQCYSMIQYIMMLIFHITLFLLQTIFYNRENKLPVITPHARTN